MAAAAAPADHHPLLFSPPPPQVMQHQVQDLAALQENHHHHQEVMQPPQAQQQPHCNYAMKTEMPPWPAMAYDHHAHPLLQPLCNAAAGAAQSSATSAPPPPAASAHLSATALLQKAAQMGATIGGAGAGGGAHYTQMAGPAASAPGGATFGLGLPGLSAQQQPVDGGVMGGLARTASRGRSGEDAGGGGGGADGMTRDFLGLRAFSHRDILDLAGFDSSCMGAVAANANMTCYEPQQHAQAEQQQQQSSNEPWHGGMGSHS